MSLFYKIFSVKTQEIKLLIYSTLLIFLIFASYAILRPIRDALGIEHGSEQLKWLFLATFIATLAASLAAMFLSTRVKRKNYLNGIYIFFISNLIAFFIAMRYIQPNTDGFLWLSRIFYVWVSVFNLFVISSAWSLLADVFTKDSSKRLFGIISAGASLGAIVGSFLAGSYGIGFIASALGIEFDISDFIFISIIFLIISLILKSLLINEAYKILENKDNFKQRFLEPIGSKNPFAGFSIVFKSRYLLAFGAFVILLTSVSTFLYMEQARIIRELFPTKEARTQAFANIDLIVQTLSFIIQIFFTAKIAQYIGLKWLLSVLGFIVAIGFVILTFTHPAFLPFVIVMSIRRVGEYALIKPGREMLFVPLSSDSKYKVKNFFDTVLYRGGDALSSQLEGALFKIGISAALIGGAIISLLWGLLGAYLGKKYEKDL